MLKDTRRFMTPDVSSLEKRVSRLRRLATKFKRAESAQNALLEISNIANAADSMEDFYQGIHSHLKKLIPADNFYIALKNQDQLELPFFLDEKDAHPTELYPDKNLSDMLKRGLTGYVLRTQKPLLCGEATAEQLTAAGEIEDLGSPCHQWLGVPIMHNGMAVGALVVQSYNPEVSYGDTEVELMVFICHHIAGVLERLRHHEQLELAIQQRTQELSQAYDKLKQEVYERRRAERLQRSLFEIADLATSNLDMHDFYVELHHIISHLLPANNCYIALLDQSSTILAFPFYVSQLSITPPEPRPLKDGLVEYLLRNRKPVLLAQKDIRHLIKQGEIYSKAPDLNHTETMQQWIGVPLLIQGEVVGALAVYSFSMDQKYQFKDLELLTFVSQHIATAIERKLATETLKRSNEQLEEMVQARTAELAQTNHELEKEISQRRRIEQKLIHDAKHDSLTGLPNRQMFMERLTDTFESRRFYKFALLFIDLDRFKIINDTLGHLEGDHFLIETAKRLNFCIRDQDLLARLGGDEFVILLDNLYDTEDAKEVAERILCELSRPFELSGQLFNSGASIGISLCDDPQQTSSESLLRDADTAMYMAKTRGKGCYVVFDEKSHQQMMHDLTLENDLRQAFESHQLRLQYIPVQDLNTNKLVALDAKPYWQHPRHGVLNYQQLAQLAEQASLQLELDRYVIELLNDEFDTLPLEADTLIHLCLSSQHLAYKHALRNLQNCLGSCRFAMDKLCLFFNEISLARDHNNHADGFESLRELGVNLGIADYGSGYSSMLTLSFLPISCLKLEAELANGIQSSRHRRLLTAIRHSAESLQLHLIADGVNSPEQRQKLQQLGICTVQGTAETIMPQSQDSIVCA
ncbi:sensor domain-containing phosphodiesterase [Shewanella dokdonensis]|uniref:Diguanylate cyclase n=1 Tax=Shewanella dokdonensis TaxID=712036 RepID=A0ABX8DHN9_9GAMM|nr:diguanylate cyclase [Shewanella dokdonensis]MCL1076247.1 diguanylate cyclase [Shewanella dokdonensis]QVK24289.1 diguanylate cyclase [Shewanella dokdonensis]